jgi:Protein of unknown function with PCYCGC motif
MTMRTVVLGTLLALAALLAAACSNSHPTETAARTTAQPAATAPTATVPAQPAPPTEVAQPPAEAIPPYFKSAEAAKPFPPLIPASFFRSNPIVARAYRTAAQYPGLVAQQPCYCHCDRLGHRSLLDCYSVEHAAG